MVAWFVLGVALFAWLLCLAVGIPRFRLWAWGWRTTGIVVSVTEGSSDVGAVQGGAYRTPPATFEGIEFRDESTGKTVRFRTTFGTNAGSMPVGASVPVKYWPGNEYLVEIDAFWNVFGFPLLALLCGAVFFGCWWLLRAQG